MVNVTANTDKEDAYKLKEFVRTYGTKIIQDALAEYINDLKEGMCIHREHYKYLCVAFNRFLSVLT